MEGFEYEGLFWDCENPENKMAGQLRFSPLDGIKLKLFGAFSELGSDFSLMTPPVRRIHGVANRAFMTLVGCQSLGSKTEMPGITREEYIVRYILSGAHFASDDDLKFDEMSISFDQLPQWVRRTGLKIKFETPTPALANVSKIDAEYTVQPDEVELVDGLELKLTLTWSTDVNIQAPLLLVAVRDCRSRFGGACRVAVPAGVASCMIVGCDRVAAAGGPA